MLIVIDDDLIKQYAEVTEANITQVLNDALRNHLKCLEDLGERYEHHH